MSKSLLSATSRYRRRHDVDFKEGKISSRTYRGFSSEAICLAKPLWPSCQVCLFGISIRTKWARARTWSPENLVLAWQRRRRRWRRRRVLLDSLITLCRLRRHMHRLLFKGREGTLKYYRVVDGHSHTGTHVLQRRVLLQPSHKKGGEGR